VKAPWKSHEPSPVGSLDAGQISPGHGDIPEGVGRLRVAVPELAARATSSQQTKAGEDFRMMLKLKDEAQFMQSGHHRKCLCRKRGARVTIAQTHGRFIR
jgi:hypothetical protein